MLSDRLDEVYCTLRQENFQSGCSLKCVPVSVVTSLQIIIWLFDITLDFNVVSVIDCGMGYLDLIITATYISRQHHTSGNASNFYSTVDVLLHLLAYPGSQLGVQDAKKSILILAANCCFCLLCVFDLCTYIVNV